MGSLWTLPGLLNAPVCQYSLVNSLRSERYFLTQIAEYVHNYYSLVFLRCIRGLPKEKYTGTLSSLPPLKKWTKRKDKGKMESTREKDMQKPNNKDIPYQ
jgi:hypothetical protein